MLGGKAPPEMTPSVKGFGVENPNLDPPSIVVSIQPYKARRLTSKGSK